MLVILAVAGLVLVGVLVRDRWPDRSAGPSDGPAPKPEVTVVSLTTLATQIERLHVLYEAGLLSDAELKRAELALLDAVPEV